jgi:hypothetical protein
MTLSWIIHPHLITSATSVNDESLVGTEDINLEIKRAGTSKELGVNVQTNGDACNATVFALHINCFAANSVCITAGTTGFFRTIEDDSIAVCDDLKYVLDATACASDVQLQAWLKFDATCNNLDIYSTTAFNFTPGATWGRINSSINETTEACAQIPIPMAATIKDFGANITCNCKTGAVTYTINKDTVATNHTFSVCSSSTGLFHDTEDVSWAAADCISVEICATGSGCFPISGSTFIQIETTDDEQAILMSSGAQSPIICGSTFLPVGGNFLASDLSGSEGPVRMEATHAMTFSDLAICISVNDLGRTNTFTNPDADISTGCWGTTPLWCKVDQGDTTVLTSSTSPCNDTMEVALACITDPVSATGHIIHTELGKSSSRTIDFTVSLMQGTCTIASFSHCNVAAGPTCFADTLSACQANSITNYNDLRIRIVANFPGGGGSPSTRGEVVQAYFETPDGTAFSNTLRVRKNSADGNQAVSIGTSTGLFTCACNTDALADGDTINLELDQNSTNNGRLTVEYTSLLVVTSGATQVDKTHTTDSVIKKLDTDVCHTTDSVIQDTFDICHTTDSIVQDTLDITHDTNSVIKKLDNDLCHTTDSVIQDTFDRTHTIDSHLQIVVDKTHTTDSIIQDTLDVTHDTDSVIKKVDNDLTHTIDSVIALQTDITHTTDSVVKKVDTDITHTTDSVLKQLDTDVTHTTDSVVQDTFDLTHTTDSHLQIVVDVTHTTDSIIQKETDLTHTIDSVIKKLDTDVTHDTDSVLKKLDTDLTHTTDSIVQDTFDLTHTTDSVLAEGLTVVDITHTTDSVLQDTFDRTHTTDSIVQKETDITHTTDSVLKKLDTDVTHTTDSIVQDTFDRTHTIDSVIVDVVQVDITHTTDSVVKKLDTDVTHTTDSIVKKVDTDVTHTTDSIIQKETDLTHDTDSVIKKVDTDITHTTDSIVQDTFDLTHDTDSVLKKLDTDITHTTDSIVQDTFDLTHTIDSVIKDTIPNVELTHTTDSVIKKVDNDLTHTIDSVIIDATQVDITHTIDSVIQKVDTDVTHTTDSVLKKLDTDVTHTTDSYLAQRVDIIHTTDSVLKKDQILTHSISSFLSKPGSEPEDLRERRQGSSVIDSTTLIQAKKRKRAVSAESDVITVLTKNIGSYITSKTVLKRLDESISGSRTFILSPLSLDNTNLLTINKEVYDENTSITNQYRKVKGDWDKFIVVSDIQVSLITGISYKFKINKTSINSRFDSSIENDIHIWDESEINKAIDGLE